MDCTFWEVFFSAALVPLPMLKHLFTHRLLVGTGFFSPGSRKLPRAFIFDSRSFRFSPVTHTHTYTQRDTTLVYIPQSSVLADIKGVHN